MVDHDLVLVVGLALVCLSVISLLSALVDERPPVVGVLAMATGVGLAAWGAIGTRHSLNPADLPNLIYTVLGRYLL